MSIKAVIFDLDGTLLDTWVTTASAVNAALRHHGFPLLTGEDVCKPRGQWRAQKLIRRSPACRRIQARQWLTHALQVPERDEHLVERTHPIRACRWSSKGIPPPRRAHSRTVNKYHAAWLAVW